MLSHGVKIQEKFSKKFFDHFLLPKNGFLNFRIRLIIKKSQLCPIAPKFFLVGSWVTKDPTGNRMSSKRLYLLGNKKRSKIFFENFSLIFTPRDSIKCIPIIKKLYF